MSKERKIIDTVRVSRAGHTFHERWAARRALQLVFPKDELFAITVEGLPPNESLKLGKEAEDIADLILYYGNGDTFETCTAQQILQFKYKEAEEPVTASYLKKTIQKFSETLLGFKKNVSDDDIAKKLSFGFVTNAKFSEDLWDAISCLKFGGTPKSNSAKKQYKNLKTWCFEKKIDAEEIFPLIEFRASISNLPVQNRSLGKTISDWTANSSGLAGKRLYALTELVREKAQIEGQGNNTIRREDVLDALECDVDQLFPADTRFIDVGEVVERDILKSVRDKIIESKIPVFLHADGGVGKTVFVQNLASNISGDFEVVIFDCFGGGAYRNEATARHLPKVGLLQIVNELASRGLCDPLLPTDSDQYGLIEIARKRLKQASETVRKQSAMQGVLIVLDAADNAQLEADVRNDPAFPKLLLASLSAEPIDGIRLLLTARPYRMMDVVGKCQIEPIELTPFTKEETKRFLESRRENITNAEFSTALVRSRGNARVLEYLVESWDTNVADNAPQTIVTVEDLIGQKCERIFNHLHTVGWSDIEIKEFFAALSLLPPPIPLNELAEALGWSGSQVDSATSDLAKIIELGKNGAIFRDEPTETYIKEHFGNEAAAQQSIAQRLQKRQTASVYAAEALPHFLVVIGDSNRAYQLATSEEFPTVIESEHGRRRLRLARLNAAFSLATREKDLDRVLRLTMQLSQLASANARGDQFIRRSPALASMLGDSDTSRRLFNDRSGWRGARDARLVVAYSFSNELDEATIHQSRAIGWINWYLHNDDENKRFKNSGPDASDIAAVMFLSVLHNNFSRFNRNVKLWTFKFALSVIEELVTLCEQHENSGKSQALQNIAEFASSKRCLSLPLQIVLLANDYGLSNLQIKSISRANSSLLNKYKKRLSEDHFDYEMSFQSYIGKAAINSLFWNSRQSAKRLYQFCNHRRPSRYDYEDRHGIRNIWIPVQSACAKAWSSGESLSFRHLLPEQVKISRKANSIRTDADLKAFLDDLVETKPPSRKAKGQKPTNEKQFSRSESEDILQGIKCILELSVPIEKVLLSNNTISNDVIIEFLNGWKSLLRPDLHRSAETARESIVRQVGIGFLHILLRCSETIEEREAKEIIEIIDANRFTLSDKLRTLSHFARRLNLADVSGTYASSLSDEIIKDDYIEQRGNSYSDLANSLVPLSIREAQVYYGQGLAQLDQMGGDDYDLIHSMLHYAADQPGGFLKPELSHRLMNLCQTIFQHEPSKFWWTLFGRAAASSIGFPAIYKLIRWHDQDVAEYSYGLPQLSCFLASAGKLDARRASIFLTISEDHGWHEWQVGDGLKDLIAVAQPEDRLKLFSGVKEKLELEHAFGGWEGLWKELLSCLDSFEELTDKDARDQIQELQGVARRKRETENARNNFSDPKTDKSFGVRNLKKNELDVDKFVQEILNDFDPDSVDSLDASIRSIKDVDDLPFDTQKRLLTEMRDSCPYDKRVNFLEAICESTEITFDSSVDLIIEFIQVWRDNTAHVRGNTKQIIEKLFAFKGSDLFVLRYSGISRQLYRLSSLCDEKNFVLETALETISKERLELGGDEWLQVATALSEHTDPSTALNTFEDLLSSSAAKVGDEIGEGEYRSIFMGRNEESNVVADIVWHLLGNSDAYIRWRAARSLKNMLELGLIEDIECLLDRFDTVENLALSSEDHHFAYLNAQQWLLMGLSRAAFHHGEKLLPLKPRIEKLAIRSDLHAVNRLHIARCLRHIDGDIPLSPELLNLFREIETPALGTIKGSGWPGNKGRRTSFSFDYEFEDNKVSKLAQLFGISRDEASDYVADEVVKRWPTAEGMSDFPGRVRYRGDERYETYREHIQRHALLNAATTLLKTKPVVNSNYYWGHPSPWKDFLNNADVSFEDGTWLSDHKDPVPAQAKEYLLVRKSRKKETLLDKADLFRKLGFTETAEDSFLPLCGSWKSPDGVHVYFHSALIDERGSVGQCTAFSKKPVHDLWLPRFQSDGSVDRHTEQRPFDPLISYPEKYPIGIDEGEEWAAHGAIARPRLGKILNRELGLKPDYDKRLWYNQERNIVLKSTVWGEWRPNSESRNNVQDDGYILWANSGWVDQELKKRKRSLVFNIDFARYKSSRSYTDSDGFRNVYVGLKRSGEDPRFWFAKKASEAAH